MKYFYHLFRADLHKDLRGRAFSCPSAWIYTGSSSVPRRNARESRSPRHRWQRLTRMIQSQPLFHGARSSTAEQWPFKPLVESSNLSALTLPWSPIFGGYFCACAHQGINASPISHVVEGNGRVVLSPRQQSHWSLNQSRPVPRPASQIAALILSGDQPRMSPRLYC